MSSYKYKTGRNTWYWTAVYIAVFILLLILMMHLYEGGYMSAWFASFIIALFALMSMSIPRRLVITEESLQIRCILDITEIPLHDIASVRAVSKREMRWKMPIFGCCGFFGFYGHFVDLKNMRHIEIYATEWRNFVEITTIYEDTYYVSCRSRRAFVEELRRSAAAARTK